MKRDVRRDKVPLSVECTGFKLEELGIPGIANFYIKGITIMRR